MVNKEPFYYIVQLRIKKRKLLTSSFISYRKKLTPYYYLEANVSLFSDFRKCARISNKSNQLLSEIKQNASKTVVTEFAELCFKNILKFITELIST